MWVIRATTSSPLERSADSDHDRGTYEIRRSDHGLEIASSFDTVLDIEKGEPKPAGVRVLLDAGTALQWQYHSRVREQHKDIGSYDITVLDNTKVIARREFALSIGMSRTDLWIVEFDAFESQPDLGQTGSGTLRLEDLSRYVPDLEDLRRKLVFPPAHPRRRVLERLHGLPYFLNPSFLVLDGGFYSFLKESGAWPAVRDGLGDYSWDDVIEAAEAYAVQARQPDEATQNPESSLQYAGHESGPEQSRPTTGADGLDGERAQCAPRWWRASGTHCFNRHRGREEPPILPLCQRSMKAQER